MRRVRFMVGAGAVLCCLVVSAAGAQTTPAAPHPQIGIGDDNLQMFIDPRFVALGIKDVRFDMSWDVLSKKYKNHFRLNLLKAWLTYAHDEGMTPLITIDHSDRKGKTRALPSVAQFSAAFRQFHRLYPWVTEFVTWDEANYYGQAISRAPRLAAEYYLALRRDCPRCTILAPDLLDLSSSRQAVPLARWAREFI